MSRYLTLWKSRLSCSICDKVLPVGKGGGVHLFIRGVTPLVEEKLYCVDCFMREILPTLEATKAKIGPLTELVLSGELATLENMRRTGASLDV